MTIERLLDMVRRRWDSMGQAGVPRYLALRPEHFHDLRTNALVGDELDPTASAFTITTEYGTIHILNHEEIAYWDFD